MTDHWKQVAWNGIRFKAPGEWQVSQIDTRHLVLEREAEPVMEVKWGSVKGTFSHQAHLKRLAASQPRKLKGRVAEWFLPPPWQKALAGFETGGFLWQTDNASGRGAILFCPACRNATLIQFFGQNSARHETLLLTVLGSFQDHRHDDRILWSIFDIQANLPARLRLLRYRFEAGRYELVFNDGAQRIHLQRWAPAAAILGGRDLIWFCGTIAEFSAGQPRLPDDGDPKVVEWCISPTGSWQRMLRRLKAKPSYYWFRLWHLENQNRILSVRAESKHPLDIKQLQRICAGYESL